MQVMRSGMQEFLSLPVEAARLQEILERFIRERGPAAEAEALKKLTVVMGSKGGVGSTTVAVNLGVQLAGLTRKRVILLDFARPLGHVDLLLDLQARFTVRHAIENLRAQHRAAIVDGRQKHRFAVKETGKWNRTARFVAKHQVEGNLLI